MTRKNKTLKNKSKYQNFKENLTKYKKMSRLNIDQDLAFKELWKLQTFKIKIRLKFRNLTSKKHKKIGKFKMKNLLIDENLLD